MNSTSCRRKTRGRSIYKLARDAYAGPSQLKNAAELGRMAFGRIRIDGTSQAIADLSNLRIAAMRVGLMQAIRKRLEIRSGRTWLMNNWKNPSMGRKSRRLAMRGRFISSLAKQAKLKVDGRLCRWRRADSNTAMLTISASKPSKHAAAGAGFGESRRCSRRDGWIQKLVKQKDIVSPSAIPQRDGAASCF